MITVEEVMNALIEAQQNPGAQQKPGAIVRRGNWWFRVERLGLSEGFLYYAISKKEIVNKEMRKVADLVCKDPEEYTKFLGAKTRMGTLTDKERLLLFEWMVDNYCTGCGCKQPESGQRCQCDNDS